MSKAWAASCLLIVEFPDRPPVILAGLGEDRDSEKKAKKKAGAAAKSKAAPRRAA